MLKETAQLLYPARGTEESAGHGVDGNAQEVEALCWAFFLGSIVSQTEQRKCVANTLHAAADLLGRGACNENVVNIADMSNVTRA